jgi:hypothetical protein
MNNATLFDPGNRKEIDHGGFQGCRPGSARLAIRSASRGGPRASAGSRSPIFRDLDPLDTERHFSGSRGTGSTLEFSAEPRRFARISR